MLKIRLLAIAGVMTMIPVLTLAGNGGIPAGHLPPPGACKIWYDGRPPGHQPPPIDCTTAERTVPYGARVIYGSGVSVQDEVYDCGYQVRPEIRYDDRDYRDRPRARCADPRHDHYRDYGDHPYRRYERGRDVYDRRDRYDDRYDDDDDYARDDRYDDRDRYGRDRDYVPAQPPVVEPRPAPPLDAYPRGEPRARDKRPLFGQGETSIILEGVEFESDSIDLTQQAVWVLDGVADSLLADPDVSIEIGGHTDSKGDADYNQFLSLMRAEAVRDYLIDAGVDGGRLYVRGHGEERPIASNRKTIGRAQNRRVELTRIDGR